MQQLLIGTEVGVGHRDGLVHQRQRATGIGPVQFDQGPRVAHERAEEHPLVRIGMAVGERDRGVDPLERPVLVVVTWREVTGVQHGHHVAGVHVDIGVGGDRAQLGEVVGAESTPPQGGQAGACLVGEGPVGMLIRRSRCQLAPADRQVERGVVAAKSEAFLAGRGERRERRRHADRSRAPGDTGWHRADGLARRARPGWPPARCAWLPCRRRTGPRRPGAPPGPCPCRRNR